MKIMEHERKAMSKRRRATNNPNGKPPDPSSVTQQAIAAGMKPITVHDRMRYQGMTLEEALSKPLLSKSEAWKRALAKRDSKEVER